MIPPPFRRRAALKRQPSQTRCRAIKRTRHALLTGAALGLLPASHAASPPDIAFFEKHIRPVLVEHCYECHSARAKSLKGGLRLDHRGGWEQGGDSGPALVPGKPEESRLLEAIRYKNADLEMPPEGALPAEVVQRFEEWIRRGAPDPREDAAPLDKPDDEIDLEAGRQFWSFRPIADPAPPAVRDSAWPLDPIDHFILSPLEAKSLPPSRDASPHAVLRRLHLDLTGLPPTVDEIERFIAHHAQDPRAAVEAKVDQLLSDPAFGERWGRHWLDLSRYADSTGGGRAIPLPDAWRYRDYVIKAFEEDRPLDQLMREHIAGDLLPYQDDEEKLRNLVATGFLVLGPHNYENQDKELLELEIIDEQLDTIGRAFLGMTIGCARCHDHKFDPIPTEDYYALAGMFTSTTSVKHANVSAWHKEPLPLQPEEQKKKAALDKEIAALDQELKAKKKSLARLQPAKTETPTEVVPSKLPGIVLDNDQAELTGAWMSSQHSPHWVGREYIHDKSEKSPEKTATFRPEIPKAGRYEVRVSYSAGPNRPENVPVTVGHANGVETVLVNQRKPPKHGKLFHSLGTFEFAAGAQAYLRISNKGTEGAVIVDAVQFLPPRREGRPARRKDTPLARTRARRPTPQRFRRKSRTSRRASRSSAAACPRPALSWRSATANPPTPASASAAWCETWGEEVPPRRPQCHPAPPTAPPLHRRGRKRTPRTRGLGRQPAEPAHRPRPRQSHLAPPLRARPRPHAGQLSVSREKSPRTPSCSITSPSASSPAGGPPRISSGPSSLSRTYQLSSAPRPARP